MPHLAFGQCANTLDQPDFSPEWTHMMSGVSEIVPLARQLPGIVQIAQALPISVVKVLNPLMAKFLEYKLVSTFSMLCLIEKRHQHSSSSLIDSGLCSANQSVDLIFTAL